MNYKIFTIVLFIFFNSYCQNDTLINEKLIKEVPKDYEIDQVVKGSLDNDSLTDYLLILTNVKERNTYLTDSRDSLTKRKVIIFKGLVNNKFKKIYDSNNVVPCRECSGKSDNLYDSLSIKNGVFIYKTCEAPFTQNSIRIKTFKLKFDGKTFKLTNYNEVYIGSPDEDDEILIDLNENEITGISSFPFNYYEWNWLKKNNLNIKKTNVLKINNIAFDFYLKKNYFDSIFLLTEVIYKFPNRVVAYLNIADCFWEINEKEKAVENYQKYCQLMKEQNKNLKKIPKYVYERLK